MMLHQFNTVFPEGYDAHCEQQKADAKKLFMDAGFINAQGECILFDGVSPKDMTDTHNNTPKPDSVLQPRFDKFKLLLHEYYNTHSDHNDEILAKADDIYIKNFNPWTAEKLRVFSYQAIGAIQEKDKNMFLFRFKNHAQGIVNFAGETPLDSFCLRGTSVDARSLSLGVNCCIDIFGGIGAWGPNVRVAGGRGADALGALVGASPREFMSTKNRILSGIMLRCQPQAQKSKIWCCLM